ncbi:esterase/lipase family protein [Microbacterium hominis]|uniref:Alpha/beta hydrolase n=1 Tax=Microbacterium hominis TaxID=162426 RepID=A0A7D4Q3Z5_9MICO|nr:hypothetical protein [Microbacterium hominis]QKJ20371.1 hypothetical protein HQM25_14040 [Microbacterium hominis]
MTTTEPRRSPALLRGLWWAADYLYAGRRQLAILAPPWTIGRPRPVPAAWRRGGDDLPEVVLIPGVYEHWTFLIPLGDALSAAGHRVSVVHGLGINRGTVASTAHRLGGVLAQHPSPDAGRVIVAHSKGGLIAKHLLVDLESGGDQLGVRGVVAVCTPFGGSRLASVLAWDRSIRDFLPSDATILALGRATSVNARIVSVFGPYDPHIPEGSALDGATNVLVRAPGHFRVLGAAGTHEAVIAGIRLLTERE